MSTRPGPSTTKTRPNSAIFLGSSSGGGFDSLASTPPSIPDLPEPELEDNTPPSPVSSSGSGLPSPPATNSTGSGSTGDPASIALRHQTRTPAATPSRGAGGKTAMLNERNVKTFHAAFSHNNTNHEQPHDFHDDFDDEDDGGGEDDTARIVRRQSLKASALDRVKSLTERNRLALDKLSSYSRGTPSPKPRANGNSTLSPPPSSASSSTTSSSSSRPLAHPRPRYSLEQESPLADKTLSGSETEREGYYENSLSSSSRASDKVNRSVTPVNSSLSRATARMRLKSAPASPGKALRSVASSSTSSSSNNNNSAVDSSPSRRRTRVSIATSLARRGDGDDMDVTEAALAAVASSRRSPTSRKRQPLPREFLDGGPEPPQTPSRHASIHLSPRHRSQDLRQHKFSTVRDLGRRGSRWLSEDMSNASSNNNQFDDEEGNAQLDDSPSVGRRQTVRGGSAESALTAGAGRVLGEGLRAAGIGTTGKQREREVVFSPDVDRSGSRLGGGRGLRAVTSMARFHSTGGDADEEDEVVVEARPSRLQQKPTTTTPREREKERVGSSMGRYTSPAFNHSTTTTSRLTPSQGQTDHVRLMMDGLGLFETNTARLVQSSSNSSMFSSGGDILKNAQSTVQLSERLNDLLRAMNTRALDEQIRVEVDGEGEGGDELAGMWREVGGDVREGLRMSDELVRSLTALLVGVGRAMRDIAGPIQEEHRRSVSLDEEGLTRHSLSPEVHQSHRSGRLSAESRRSWDNPSQQRDRHDTLQRLTGPSDTRDRERNATLQRLTSRPESALRGERERPGSVLNLLRERGDLDANHQYETPPPKTLGRSATINGKDAPPSGSMRRLFVPREHHGMNSFDSQDTLLAPEPSPTPASRQAQRASPNMAAERSRTLPPLAIPRGLASDTPGSAAHRRNQTTADTPSRESTDRVTRKPSVTTVRHHLGTGTGTPTTAITPHTVTHSPVAFPQLSRNDSSGTPSRAPTRPVVGRSSTLSSNALNGLKEQQLADQQRARTGSSAEALSRSSLSSASDAEGAPGNGTTRRAPASGTTRGPGHAADRSAALTISSANKQRRRPTVTELFPPERS